MLRWFALALLVVPGAQACADAVATADLDLVFEKPCARDQLDDCPPLPQADAPYVVDGVLSWSWELDAACGLAVPSTSPVHVHLSGVERHNAGWLRVTADPAEITIQPTSQWDLTDADVDPAAGRVRARETYPVRVTIALVGEPTPEALERLESRAGLVQVDLRADAGATETFLAATTFESFWLDGRPMLAPDDAQGRLDVPAPTAALALLAVALAGALRRR